LVLVFAAVIALFFNVSEGRQETIE